MLWEVLHAIEAAQSPLDLNELSRRLKIDRGVLDDIIQFWVRKGRLVENVGGGSVVCTAASSHACSGCASHGDCPFTMKLPRTISLRRSEITT
ncbi:MAG: hypothetical protein IPK16_06220 [Anaerolineales bacterium]|nr:hypothetical protein [Anaerolineales bacterium]